MWGNALADRVLGPCELCEEGALRPLPNGTSWCCRCGAVHYVDAEVGPVEPQGELLFRRRDTRPRWGVWMALLLFGAGVVGLNLALFIQEPSLRTGLLPVLWALGLGVLGIHLAREDFAAVRVRLQPDGAELRSEPEWLGGGRRLCRGDVARVWVQRESLRGYPAPTFNVRVRLRSGRDVPLIADAGDERPVLSLARSLQALLVK